MSLITFHIEPVKAVGITGGFGACVLDQCDKKVFCIFGMSLQVFAGAFDHDYLIQCGKINGQPPCQNQYNHQQSKTQTQFEVDSPFTLGFSQRIKFF